MSAGTIVILLILVFFIYLAVTNKLSSVTAALTDLGLKKKAA
jgi:hypothetical protein